MDEDKLTIEFTLLETQFISAIMRGVANLEEDEVSDAAAMAQHIHQKLVDAAVMDGKIPIDHLPPPEDEDEVA